MPDAIINAKNLCCKTGNRYLLDHINWEVKRGEHWLIFGMNGSGKTTLLSTVTGVKPITSGELTVLGKPFNSETIFSLRKKVGWVSCSFFDKYFSNETTLQIVLSGLTGTLNVDYSIKTEDVQRAKTILRELRMGDKINHPFHLMSKGERQNVLFARALISSPEILVLDEPTTGLDFIAKEHFLTTICTLAKNEKITILYITHSLDEIQPFMNKTMLLRNGCAIAQGNTEEVFTDQNISHLLGEPIHITKSEDGVYKMKMMGTIHSKINSICYK